ncbi:MULTISPECIES: hypothetical protein [Klebsiella]|uniref:hypothetical protein n=1 Tax=Klebsiella TaxID=570 RepID=UPI000E2BD104|nr:MULTISPECIES: hypothetical protein [Klebsiella]MBF7863471.1 hypothetical protein [Klebsiella quasipneumoniae]HDS9265742.1 hypothetical protein [Klebsiella pneumoniae subsp. pneumoniae]EIX9763090.1 hypothetical protein [Klebsiella pneumoniae]EKO6115726.1 hypothetical protein [Klebsiella pneumoniae]EKV8689217.1 hypothetical protein [Klebsiella pneumoniae]
MNSNLTDERIDALLEKVGVFTLEKSQDLWDVEAALSELQERRKAAMEKRPVAWRWRWSDDVDGYWRYTEEERETRGSVTVQQLYHHAPPSPVTQSEPAGWQFKSVNGDWIGLLGESGKDQAIKEGCEVRPLYAVPQLTPLVLTDEQIDAVLDANGNMAYVIADKRERLRMFAREILRAASTQPENQQTRALVMWIKRLSLALRSASPDNKLPKAAIGYLQNNSLISITDCLRGKNEEPPA